MIITTYIEQGIKVQLTKSMNITSHIDCWVYFAGETMYYMPTTHASVHEAMIYALRIITRFVADGGLEAYKARMMAYDDDFRYTRI